MKKNELTAKAAQSNGISVVSKLPNLHKADVSPQELSSEYWTPEEKGEYKVGIIFDLTEETYDNAEGESIELPCIIMLSQNEDGSFSTIRNGSKRLFATIESAVDKGSIVMRETPVKITYTGKQKNKTNSFQSDRWSVKTLNL